MELNKIKKCHFCFLYFLFLIMQTYCNGSDELYHGISTFDKTGTIFQKLLLDKSTGTLYVGAQNEIFRFASGNLTLVQNVIIGPEMDKLECDPTNDKCTGKTLMDNDVKIMLIDPKYDKLLLCGSIRQGICSFFDKANLSSSIEIAADSKASAAVNYVGGKGSVVARYGYISVGSKQYTCLYVAQEYDNRPMNLSPFAVSTRGITFNNEHAENPEYLVKYLYSNPQHTITTAKDINHEIKADYFVKYIHTFEYGNFSFYLTIQRQYIDHGNFSTRLVRVCNTDPGYYSYTEIELACRKKNGVTSFFNMAVAAYVGHIGKEFAERFNINYTENVLFITFGKSFSNSVNINEEAGSGLCLFTMSSIMREFMIAQKDCYLGKGYLLPWIHPGNIECQEKYEIVEKINQDINYCGDDARNDAIGRRSYTLQTDTNVTLAGHYATSILIQAQNQKTVAILGTAEGTILKVLIDGTNAPPYIDINIAPSGLSDPRVAKDMIFDRTGSHIFAMTRGRVVRVPIQTCDLYTDCASCVSTRDALRCGWCSDGDGYCSSKRNCDSATWSQDSCPPSLIDFHPKSGPVQGGTLVTIHGANFGNATAPGSTIKISVAFEPCESKFHNTTMMICKTGPSTTHEQSNLVSVEIVDASKTTAGFEIRGHVNFGHISYSYKEAKLTDIAPLMGPKSGGSRLTITGQNLNIGSDLKVSVVDAPCVPFSIKSAEILCKTSPLPVGADKNNKKRSAMRKSDIRHKRSLASGVIKVAIDGVLLSKSDLVFEYDEDPFVTDVYPRKSIVSGGINITVTGGNLQVVHRPQMVIQDQGVGVNYFDDCEAVDDIMVCTSPPLYKESDKGPTPGHPLILTLNFAMDGVPDLIDFPNYHPELSAFEYHVDPILHNLDDDDTVIKFYTNENYLEMKGSYMNQGVDGDDYQITIGGDQCVVTSLKADKIYCNPTMPKFLQENEEPREVIVKVGNVEFTPGHIKYAERNVLLATLLPSFIAGVIAVVIVIFVVILWLRKTHKGPFKRHTDLQSVRYTRNPDSTDGNDRLMHSNPYTSSTQMLRQRHVVEREHEPLIDRDCRKFLDDSHLLIDRDDLLLLDIIGQGNFGCVFKGLLKVKDEKQETEVAVKTLKTLTEAAYTSTADARSFLEEALRMREFDHPHILRLIGIALDKEEQPLVILPFMKHGDLLTYIRDETNSPTIKDLMDFGIQVAEGMAYLSKLKFVHRDLAARNCMLNDSMEVQVADFGLSRDIYERDYYSSDGRKAKLPVKWMSLESLEKGIYNTKTDVWSYGVVLWELMTRGVTPYPEVDNWEIIKFLKPGRRMPQPAYCPDSLYRLMHKCWDPDPSNRPPFYDIVTAIQRIMYDMENRQEQQHQATNDMTQHMYSNVPTSQTYLYPSTLPHYAMHGVGPGGGGGLGMDRGGLFQSGDRLELSIRDHNENEHMPNVIV